MRAKISLNQLYRILLRRYGPQGWWPVYFSGSSRNRPGLSNAQLEIMLGAVLTQNTAWTNVRQALDNLDKAGLIDWQKVARVRNAKLARLIRPAGYYNQKAGYIHNLVKALRSRAFKWDLPSEDLRRFLLEIKGIGEETGDSILLYAFLKPIFVVDAYTKRLFIRIGLIAPSARYREVQDFVHNGLALRQKKIKVYQEFHALIVRHAKEVCRVKPKCRECFLKRQCLYQCKIKNEKCKTII